MTERGGAVHIPMVSEDGALVKDNLLQQLDQFVGKVSRHECLDGDRDVIWVGRLVESSLDHLWRRHTLPSNSESMENAYQTCTHWEGMSLVSTSAPALVLHCTIQIAYFHMYKSGT